NTNGVLYLSNSSGTVAATATGGAGTLCLVSTNGGTPTFGACSGSTATAWSSLTAPSANLSFSMGTNTTTFTWPAAGNVFHFSSVGNVGIGTSSPSEILQLTSSGTAGTGLVMTNTS